MIEMNKTRWIRSSVATMFLFGALCFHANAAWATGEDLVNCTCYYGYDEECAEDEVCTENFNPINCQRRKPKGGSHHGKCTEDDQQTLIRPCDANCAAKGNAARHCQGEDPNLVEQVLDLWLQAMTQPAISGGGPIDPDLAAQARAVPVDPACSDYLGWRVLAIMEMCRGNDFVFHPEDHEELEDHILADISGDTCRIESGNKCVEAVTQGLFFGEKAVDPLIDSISASCPDGLPFGNTGLPTSPIEGVKQRLRVTVFILRSPDPIPTVSEWGLIILFLLLLTAGTIVIRRQMAQQQQPATA